MGKISIQDLANVLVERKKFDKREAVAFVTTMFEIVQHHLEDDKLVKIKGLGTFKIVDVEDRESVNVNTGERVLIEGHGKITFVPDALMKELVNKPFSQFETVVLNEGVDFADTEIDQETLPLVEFGESKAIPEEPLFPEYKEESEPEPEPEPEPESEPEPEPEPEHEPEHEPEPAIPETPVEPEPEIEAPAPAEEPLAEEPMPEPDSEPEIEAEYVPELTGNTAPRNEEKSAFPFGSKSWIWGIALGLVFGYLLGHYLVPPHRTSDPPLLEKQEVKAPEQPKAPQPKVATPVIPVEADSAKPEPEDTVVPLKPVKMAEASMPEEQAKPATEPVEAAKPAAKSTKSIDPYAAKDERVRLGAWIIVGTDKEVTVRESQSVQRLSKAYLGPGMECYVEVYNNLPRNAQLKAGQKIKIPKLVSKIRNKKSQKTKK